MGFVIALGTISSLPNASQATEITAGLEARLASINAALQQRASQLPVETNFPKPGNDVVAGFANRSGGGGFGNARGGGGFVNRGGGGGFANVNPWRNGWSDGGGFVNRW